MRHRTALIALAVPAALLLVACGEEDTTGTEGGFGLPTVSPDQVTGERTDLSGTLTVERNGCFMWSGDGDPSERRWVVWPASADHDDVHVVLGDGSRLTDGDAVVGTGLRADATALPDWASRDSYFHAFGTFCRADERGVVVFDEVIPPGS